MGILIWLEDVLRVSNSQQCPIIYLSVNVQYTFIIFYFPASDVSQFRLFFKKSLFIKRDQLQLNKITIPFP